MPAVAFSAVHDVPAGRQATTKSAFAMSMPTKIGVDVMRTSRSDRSVLARPCGYGVAPPGNCTGSRTSRQRRPRYLTVWVTEVLSSCRQRMGGPSIDRPESRYKVPPSPWPRADDRRSTFAPVGATGKRNVEGRRAAETTGGAGSIGSVRIGGSDGGRRRPATGGGRVTGY